MMNTFKGCLLALVVVGFGAGRASAGFQLLDDFNRPDSPSLGPNWTSQAGSIGVSGQKATGTSGDSSLSTFNSAASTSIEMDIFSNGAETQYAAAVLGYGGLNNNLFVKVQNNGSSGERFDTYAFYYGNNGINGSLLFGTLTTQFTSGRMLVTESGTSVTLSIDAGFTGTFSQVYTYNYTPAQIAALGSGIGIGTFGSASIDNFGVFTSTSVPEPSSLALVGVATVVIGLARLRTRRVPAAS